ncbi:MAG: ABC transporter permease [Planctomycetota bacterium]|nr:MAG: ABC transporter permease [Planctomycetota bacterium]
MWVIYRRELGAYFLSPLAYIFLIAFLSLNGLFFADRLWQGGVAELRELFLIFPITFLAIVPAMSMRIWAEEKKSGTFEVLMTLPLSSFRVVWGKFLAAWTFLTMAVLLTLVWVFEVENLADYGQVAVAFGGEAAFQRGLDWGPIILGYVATIFLAGVYLAIGCFFSSLTKNQILAFILTAFVLVLFYLFSTDVVLAVLEKWSILWAEFFYYLSFTSHFKMISKGVLEAKSFVYLWTTTWIFLELTRLSVGWRS